MARPEYPHSRRIYMQVALCIVFCASVGLAEIVTRQHRLTSTHLASKRNLPPGFLLTHEGTGPIDFIAQEPDRPGAEGRTLTGRRERLAVVVSPIDYLRSVDILNDATRIIATASDGDGIEEITMGGTPGVLFAVKRQADNSSQIRWIACSVRPSGLAITLLLDCPENDDLEADRQTLRDMAAELHE